MPPSSAAADLATRSTPLALLLATPSSVATSPPPASTSNDSRWLAWTAVGVGSGLLALSAWQWIVFASENTDAGDVCPARSGELARCADVDARARYIDARDDAKRARVLGAVFGGLGAAALVTGILLFPDDDASPARPSVSFSADPLAGNARASVFWTW